MTANPLLYCQSLGFGPIDPPDGMASFSLNGAASGGYSQNWLDMAFRTNFVSGSPERRGKATLTRRLTTQ